MTNEQLAVLLNHLHERLVSEIGNVDVDLPAGIERYSCIHQKPGGPGSNFLPANEDSLKNNPDLFEKIETDAIILDGLREIADSISLSIAFLREEE